MTETDRKPGVGFYLTGGYIIAMYVAYYYFWGRQFAEYVRTVLGLH